MNESSPRKIITRTRAQTSSAFPSHVTSLLVPFFEVDMGHAVYHGNYYHIFELAREDFMRKTGFPYREFLNRQLHLTLTESHCKYRKALYYEDEIEVHTAITSMSRRNVSFSQLIYRQARNPSGGGREAELCTECQLYMICVRVTGQPTFLPEGFRLAVSKMLQP